MIASLLLSIALAASTHEHPPAWLGEEMPLPLSVKSPEDLAFKALAERQYLVFNLLASGKLAWDKGDFTTAAEKWEALLRIQGLPAEIDTAVRPLAETARKRAGSMAAMPLPPPPQTPAAAVPASAQRNAEVTVSGHVSGGGSAGPTGAVVWLERADGRTPKPRPLRGKLVLQREKVFLPHVTVIPIGSQVSFRNEDEIFHNVFSLTRDSKFDLGLYGKGLTKTAPDNERHFDQAGPVQLLCNIHSSMQAWVYVVDSPWYAEVGADGGFHIKAPPGDYVVAAWHEASSRTTRQKLAVGDDGASVDLTVGGDVKPPSVVPDKYGKPRQVQLGY